MVGVKPASRRTVEAAAGTGVEAARAAVDAPPPAASGAGTADPLIGDLRRAGLLPLLVLHFASAEEPAYGNQLIERIAQLTGGALHVNPNTMYPLLRSLEGQGFVAGEWEHPERRSRRFYRVTEAGRAERLPAGRASWGRGWTGSPPRSRPCGRSCCSPWAGRRPRSRCPGGRPGRSASGTTRTAGRRGSTASATWSSSRATGPTAARASSGSRRPAGAGASRSA